MAVATTRAKSSKPAQSERKKKTFQENSPVGMPVAGSIQAYISNWAETGRYITPEIARSSPTVHACVLLISQSIARMEWKVLMDSNGVRVPAPDHPLYRLLNFEPNPHMGALTWKQSMLMDCLLYGNGYSYIERDRSGNVLSLEKLRPDLMTVMRSYDDNSVVYSYAAGVPGARTFPGYDIFHLIGPSDDGLIGEPPIYLARQMIGVEIEAETFVASFFHNGARPAGVLQVAGNLSPEAYTRLKDSWQAMQGGARNAGRIAILEAGYEWKQVSINPDDAQLIELRKYCREQIAAAFGVPPHMIGDTAQSSYASAEQSDIEFTKHTLGTWAARLEEETARKLIRPRDRIKTEISFEVLTRGDLAGRFSSYAIALNNGFLTVDEIRSKEGMAPVPGGSFIRAPLNLGPLPTKIKEPSDTPSGPDASAAGIGQLQALTAMAQAIKSQAITRESAMGILAASFPLLSEDQIQSIVGPELPPAPPQLPPDQSQPPQLPQLPPAANAPPQTNQADQWASERSCGTGAGGFQSGNDCAKGGDGSDSPSATSSAEKNPGGSASTSAGNLDKTAKTLDHGSEKCKDIDELCAKDPKMLLDAHQALMSKIATRVDVADQLMPDGDGIP